MQTHLVTYELLIRLAGTQVNLIHAFPAISIFYRAFKVFYLQDDFNNWCEERVKYSMEAISSRWEQASLLGPGDTVVAISFTDSHTCESAQGR